MKISSSFIKLSLIILVMLFLVYTFIGNVVHSMIYPASSTRVSSPPPQGFKEVRIEYMGNDSIICWLYENKTDLNAPVILIFHGNGENLETMRLNGIFHQFMRLNVHFLAVDYPGYGRSSGKPSEEDNVAAANAAFNWILNNFGSNPKIIFGWSLGAAVAIQTAANHTDQIVGLIGVSPWTSLPDVAATHYPRFLVNCLVKESYNSIEAAQKIRCPVLLIHGEKDNIIPFSHGEKVAQAMESSVHWVSVKDAGHNDIFNTEIVWEEIASFTRAIRE